MSLFVVLFAHRSGSSHLVSLLNSHPEIRAHGEVFDGVKHSEDGYTGQLTRQITKDGNSIKNPNPKTCVSLVEEWMDGKGGIQGFKFKFPKQAGLFPEVNNKMHEFGSSLKVVELRRSNLVRRALSHFNHLRIREMTGRSNFRSSGTTLSPIELDLDGFVVYVRRLEKLLGQFNDWVNGFPERYQLDYESLISESGSLRNLQRFLGVKEVRSLRSKVIKATPSRLEDAIANYSGFRDRMLQEGWGSFLDDEQSKAA